MIKEIIVNKILTDFKVKELEGTWIDEDYIKYPLVNKDTDIYYIENNEKKLLLKFRKHVISSDLIEIGWESYKNLAKPSRGRGASAGPIDKIGTYWSKRKIIDTNKWSTSYILNNGNKSKMKVNNQVASNPIGFFESSNNFNKLPCRLTHFTRTNFDKYQNGLPFICKINELYKQLIPNHYNKQYIRAQKNPKFQIKKNNIINISDYYNSKKDIQQIDYYNNNPTAFSTITINRNFRTALHRDAGDFKEGFGNLTVIEKGEYSGGYTIFPQFGVAVDVRTRDFLACDVHQWHSNTPIYETEKQKKLNKTLPKYFKDNPAVGTVGIYENYSRLTFVCYLREKIIKCQVTDERFLEPSDSKKL
tara:strand:+ start:1640 stop:2722 length:1083 start_codon:yes stop_codon:yes gene_type:complete